MQRLLLAAAIVLAVPGVALANAAAPGPVVWFGGMNTALGVTWFLGSMALCIGVEGVILHVTRALPRPYLASFQANWVSFAFGLPAACIGGVFDEFILIATGVTILVEAAYLTRYARKAREGGAAVKRWYQAPVLLGNLLSNLLLFWLLTLAMLHFPSGSNLDAIFCLELQEQVVAAKASLAEERSLASGSPVLAEELTPSDDVWRMNAAPRDGRLELRMGGCQVTVGSVGADPACARHGPFAKLVDPIAYWRPLPHALLLVSALLLAAVSGLAWKAP